MTCPCGSMLDLEQCCLVFLSGKSFPENAEKLMRSRYTAYSLKNYDYINRAQSLKGNHDVAASNTQTPSWIRLEIISKRFGGSDDKVGFVEFKAYYQEEDREFCLHENSKFKRVGGRWMYVGGNLKK